MTEDTRQQIKPDICVIGAGPGGLAAASAAAAFGVNVVLIEKAKMGGETIKPRADAWPRLDPGAVLCKSEDDLLRLAASRRGEQVNPPDCLMIRAPTAVTIERRAGLGRTQVALTDQKGVDGWTDAWLPERAPPIGGKGVQIK